MSSEEVVGTYPDTACCCELLAFSLLVAALFLLFFLLSDEVDLSREVSSLQGIVHPLFL